MIAEMEAASKLLEEQGFEDAAATLKDEISAWYQGYMVIQDEGAE